MTEMIERVARAMMEDFRQQMEAPKGLHGQADAWTAEGGTIDFERVARAGIEAMRMPTDAMVLAGARYHDDNWRPTHAREDTNAEAIWHDMLDAALVEPQP